MYTMPSFPLLAAVWYQADYEPLPPPDEGLEVFVSLSPIKPLEMMVMQWNFTLMTPTHIIRSLPDPLYRDSTLVVSPSDGFPTTMFEVPLGSGHFYAVVFAHEVGAGFANHHARLYVCKYKLPDLDGKRTFTGYI